MELILVELIFVPAGGEFDDFERKPGQRFAVGVLDVSGDVRAGRQLDDEIAGVLIGSDIESTAVGAAAGDSLPNIARMRSGEKVAAGGHGLDGEVAFGVG